MSYSSFFILPTKAEVASFIYPQLKNDKLVTLKDNIIDFVIKSKSYKNSELSQCHAGLLFDYNINSNKINVSISPCFTPAAPNRWAFTKAKTGKQNFLIYRCESKSSTANREILASFRVACNAPVQIAISLGRHGTKCPYEGTTVKQKLTPGQPWAGVLKHRFRENHNDLKLQFEVLDCAAASCILEIQESSIDGATITHSNEPVFLSPNSFSVANKLYREGKYAEALKIYEALAARYSLGVYRENAKMAKAKLAAA